MLHLGVRNDPPLLEIDEEELAGLKAPLAEDIGGRDVEHAGFGRENDPAVAGLEPPPGPQAVAVERRADHPAVRERDRGRAVPRFHHALVVGVEPEQLGWKVGAPGCRLGDHHHDRVRQRAAAEDEELEDVVERRRVRAAALDDRKHLLEIVAEELRGELRLARPHPVHVAPNRVDLPVVSDHPVRVRELPARERVRREPGVDERKRGLGALVAEIGEVAAQLRRGEHSLVDDRAGGEARDDRLGAALELEATSDHVQLALESVLVARHRVPGGDDELSDEGCRRSGRDPDARRIDGHVAPAHETLTLLLDEGGEMLLERTAPFLVDGQEAHCHAVPARLGQRLVEDRSEERVGELEEDAGAVARAGVCAGRTPVLQVLERLQRALDRLVPWCGIQPRHECHSARIVLVVGRVEALLRPARHAHCRLPARGWIIAGIDIREFTRTQSPRPSGVECGRERQACFKD